MTKKQKIVVAMSGGVDSSTVAAMLAAEGHEVIGVTLQLYDYGVSLGKKGACCAGQDIYDAQMAAEKIDIPHYVLNYESIFKESVMEDFADSYLRGETPIPCVKCNQSVKFRDLFKVAKDLGADKLATGHYVQKIINNGKAELHQGFDPNKDQSYFLFATTKEQLDFLMFPLGGLTKDQTRELARGFGLTIADKPDSQDICFVPNGNYAAIVEKLRPGALDKGNFIDVNGNVIGTHDGIINFTVGQRRGIGIAASDPLYVIKIIPETKEIVIGPKDQLFSSSLKVRDLNWLGHSDIPAEGLECRVKLRSAHVGQAAMVYKVENEVEVKLAEYHQGISPGQACVIYDNTRLLGGGWITRS